MLTGGGPRCEEAPERLLDAPCIDVLLKPCRLETGTIESDDLATATGSVSSGSDTALDRADAEALVALPRLQPVLVAESDSDDGSTDIAPAAKLRKITSSEPADPLRAALRPELLSALEAHGAAFLRGCPTAIEDFCLQTIAAEHPDDSFYVYNLATVEKLYNAWTHMMPRVHPCYAVKCNPDGGLLTMLAALGAGFDCASQAEVAQVLSLGVDPQRIIYAHPCKPASQIRWAAAHGINLTTFDTESELHKMAQLHPGCSLLLRIRADDPSALCPLGSKYGAELAAVPHLLNTAAALGLAVRGVSFHVGSGSQNPAAFAAAIEAARLVFDQGLALGFQMDILDLGGGFCARFNAAGEVDLGGVPAAINAALDRHFPDDGQLRIIAEPGRYFAEACATFACHVNGWRERQAAGGERCFDYFISDGVYGSLNCLLYDVVQLAPSVLRSPLLPAVPATVGSEALFKSTLFGPTCDSLDTVLRDYPMPRLRNGDWVAFHSFGACFDAIGARRHYVYTV